MTESKEAAPEKSGPSQMPDTRLEPSLSDLAKLGVAIVGLIYAVGFLVVTFHLSKFDVAPVTWLRPQYLLAGIWCLLPPLWLVCGLAIIAQAMLSPWIRGSLDVPRRTRIYRHVVGGIQGFAMTVVVLGFLAFGIDSVVNPSFSGRLKLWSHASFIALGLFLLLLLSAAALIAGMYPLLGAANPEPMRTDRRIMTLSLGIPVLFLALLMALDYVRLFSNAVYSAIPSTYGGGRQQNVVFLIDRADQRPSPVIPDSSGTRSIPYNLLLVTESNYVVESPSKSELAIEFKQDSVRGMIVLR
jgi:hypothetical protein